MFNRIIRRGWGEGFSIYLAVMGICLSVLVLIYSLNETAKLERQDVFLAFVMFSLPIFFLTEVDEEAAAMEHKRYMERKQVELEFVKAKALPTASSIELKIDKLNGLFTGEIEKR